MLNILPYVVVKALSVFDSIYQAVNSKTQQMFPSLYNHLKPKSSHLKQLACNTRPQYTGKELLLTS